MGKPIPAMGYQGGFHIRAGVFGLIQDDIGGGFYETIIVLVADHGGFQYLWVLYQAGLDLKR